MLSELSVLSVPGTENTVPSGVVMLTWPEPSGVDRLEKLGTFKSSRGEAGAGVVGAGVATGVARTRVSRTGVARTEVARVGVARTGVARAGVARTGVARTGVGGIGVTDPYKGIRKEGLFQVQKTH